MAGITTVLSFAASRGLDPKQLCETVGLDVGLFGNPLTMVPFTLTRRVWLTVIEQLPHENVGVGVGAAARSEHVGYAGLLLRQARNGLELVQLMIDAAPISDTALVADPVTLRQRGEQVEVHIPAMLSAGIPERTEAAFLMLLLNMRRLGLPELKPLWVRAAHVKDAKRALVEPHYGCKVQWDAGEDVMCFPRAPLQSRLPGSHPRAADTLRSFIADEVKRRSALSFPDRVREVVEQQVRIGSLSQEDAASALGMSARSLQRKLGKSALRYRDVRGKLLESRAAELMHNQAYSLEDIALKLGYSELSSFSRSWKRLTGQSPASYRAQLLGLRSEA